MVHMKFQEYLERNKKLRTTAHVKKIADFEGKVDAKPSKEVKHKDAGGKGQDGEVKPYKSGSDAKDPNKNKMKDGFAEKGDKKLNYQPDTFNGKNKGEEGVPGGKKAISWPKTKTQEWVDKTKRMSLSEFTKKIRGEVLDGLNECSCQETPHDSIKETIDICKCNERYIPALVREMKRNGLFEKLMQEMVNHTETFDALAKFMENEVYARKLAKAMNEMVAGPMSNEDGDMNLLKKKKKPVPMDDMDDKHDDEMDNDDHEDEMDNDDHEDNDADSDDMGDEGDEDHGDEDASNDEDYGDEGSEMDDNIDQPVNKFLPKKKKPMAHHNLMNAMKDQPALMGRGGLGQ